MDKQEPENLPVSLETQILHAIKRWMACQDRMDDMKTDKQTMQQRLTLFRPWIDKGMAEIEIIRGLLGQINGDEPLPYETPKAGKPCPVTPEQILFALHKHGIKELDAGQAQALIEHAWYLALACKQTIYIQLDSFYLELNPNTDIALYIRDEREGEEWKT